ncbi:MAG: endonuclease III [Thermodesulfobacteriota bacterium]|nr:MAG: endonuclease III [Thermodesulfobacteriota bacterium]
MNEKDRILNVIEILEATYGDAHIALKSVNPFQLLVSVILSAQCTDVRVNQVTPVLFERFPDIRSMSEAPREELEELIRTTGFFRNKAKNIKAASRIIVERFKGEIPRTMEEMVTIPGVGRKTANIVLYNAYGVIAGIAVDTHVKRLAKRLGMTLEDNPIKIERDLMAIIPKKDWGEITYVLINHGRQICKARKPNCRECPVRGVCQSVKQSGYFI